MGLPDLSGLFQYQINYFFVIPFSGACSNPSGLSNYFTRPVYSYIKSFYLPYSPHSHPPFFSTGFFYLSQAYMVFDKLTSIIPA